MYAFRPGVSARIEAKALARLENKQLKLAEKIDISLRNVRRIEAGEINPLATTLIRLRKALGCSADKLMPPA